MAEQKTKVFYTKQEVQQMLKGEHPSQTKKVFGYDSNKAIKREVGEKWEELDENGNVKWVWEQKNGYRVKSAYGTDFNPIHHSWEKFNYPNCYEDCSLRTTKKYNRLDEKYRKIYGMCSECASKYETRLKTSGSWQAFERAKMLENAKSFFNEADDAVQQVADRLKKVEFVANETGKVESWAGDEEKANQLMEEYNMYKELIFETLEGKRTDVII